MKDVYQPLFEPLTLINGVTLRNRFVMCPMLVFCANQDGTPSPYDVAYFKRRAHVGELLITGATTPQTGITCAVGQLQLDDDQKIDAFKDLAQAMKSEGSKAILQIQHPGRQATVGYQETGVAYAPSKMDFPFLDYPVTELSDAQIRDIIAAFAQTTRRAMEAGFDGVEIHGANHYLIQQFFSAYSNHREDDWGGSLEKRMNFAKEITKAVLAVAKEKAGFIVGYRFSPEEVHGKNIGYTVDDTVKLINEIADLGVDYIHSSTFGNGFVEGKAYAMTTQVQEPKVVVNKILHDALGGKVPYIVSGSISDGEDALDALHYGELAGMGVAAIADPDMANKLKEGNEDTINMNIVGRVEDLAIPPILIDIYKAGVPLPPIQGIEEL
ncbi:hypothetical protein A4S06_08750 [Erysipelotrichaceae bacterium MTC7]|nr:hypothetical protein A4S06_08750 [Erysipelotrichaceae bacterium MTC7]